MTCCRSDRQGSHQGRPSWSSRQVPSGQKEAASMGAGAKTWACKEFGEAMGGPRKPLCDSEKESEPHFSLFGLNGKLLTWRISGRQVHFLQCQMVPIFKKGRLESLCFNYCRTQLHFSPPSFVGWPDSASRPPQTPPEAEPSLHGHVVVRHLSLPQTHGAELLWNPDLHPERSHEVVRTSDQDCSWSPPFRGFWAHPTGKKPCRLRTHWRNCASSLGTPWGPPGGAAACHWVSVVSATWLWIRSRRWRWRTNVKKDLWWYWSFKMAATYFTLGPTVKLFIWSE